MGDFYKHLAFGHKRRSVARPLAHAHCVFRGIVDDFDSLGFGSIPATWTLLPHKARNLGTLNLTGAVKAQVTSVFGGLALAGNSTHPFFEQVGKAASAHEKTRICDFRPRMACENAMFLLKLLLSAAHARRFPLS